MDSQIFLGNFGSIADAPGGVDRLRELVYDLAYSGRLIADGGGLPTRTGWSVATLAEVCDRVQDCEHRTPKYSRTGIPALRPRDVSGGRLDLGQAARVGPDEYAVQIRRYEPAVGDIAYSRELSLGWAVQITHTPVCLSQGMVAITPGKQLHPQFLVSFLNGPARRKALELAVGSAHPHLNLKDIRQFEVPVPPMVEQERIVAKVDELMQLCDDLEARQQARKRASTDLRASCLHALTNAQNDHELQDAWSRIRTNWESLIVDAKGAEELRPTLLTLATRGAIEIQDPADESADELLTRIQAKRNAMIERSEIRRPAQLKPISASQTPFDLPSGWSWTRLGSILSCCRNGISTKTNDNGAGFALLRISAGTSDPNWRVDLGDHKFADIDLKKAEQFAVAPGDLLACRFNGNLRYVGLVSQVPMEIPRVTLHPDKLIRMAAIEVNHSFLRFWLNSPLVRMQIEDAATTTAGNIGINGSQLQNLLLPIPPLPEQLRIARRLQNLFDLTTNLRSTLETQSAIAERLSASVVATITSQHSAEPGKSPGARTRLSPL